MQQIEAMVSLADSYLISDDNLDEAQKYLEQGTKVLMSLDEQAGVNPLSLLYEARKKKLPEEERKKHLQYITKEYRFRDPEQAKAFAVISMEILNSPRRFQHWQKNSPSLGAAYLSAVGAMHQMMGAWWFRDGELDEARKSFGWAADFHSILPYNRLVGSELIIDYAYFAEILRRKGELEDAQRFFLYAHELATIMDSPDLFDIYAGLARTSLDRNEINSAINYYREAICY
jgi:tetratricopeptide (TPR) repeat protein